VTDDWYYLLRTYDMRLVDTAAIDSYLRDAFLPAVKRLGVGRSACSPAGRESRA
jgi:hypothetical protein